jgi:hypothetical protein
MAGSIRRPVRRPNNPPIHDSRCRAAEKGVVHGSGSGLLERLELQRFGDVRRVAVVADDGDLARAPLEQHHEFVHVFINFNADESESVTELASFKAFSAAGPDRWLAPPDVVRLGVNVVEAYSAERMPATA